MEIRNNSNMSFQASIPRQVKEEILNSALDHGAKAIRRAKGQIRNVESWGSRDVILDLKYASKQEDGRTLIDFFPDTFVLSKDSLPTGVNVDLPKKKSSIFDTFMALRKRDILNAETKLAELEPAPKAPNLDFFE